MCSQLGKETVAVVPTSWDAMGPEDDDIEARAACDANELVWSFRDAYNGRMADDNTDGDDMEVGQCDDGDGNDLEPVVAAGKWHVRNSSVGEVTHSYRRPALG
jgi:hypothetical protein